MPTYQYRCEKCGKTFECTETISEHEVTKPQCPNCRSKKVSAIPGRVYVVTSNIRRAKMLQSTRMSTLVGTPRGMDRPLLMAISLSLGELLREGGCPVIRYHIARAG
jgi:putative FmdB family regulatory protein